jgi:uncharacterized protein YraI
MTNQDQTTNQSAAQSPSDPPSNSGTNKILIVAIILLGIVVIALAAFILFGRDNTGEVAQPPVSVNPTPPEISVPTPLPGTPMVTALAIINIRSGPGTNYPSYGVAPEGAQGMVIGVSEDGGWWVVQVPNPDLVPEGQGWVSGEFVRAENTDGVPVIPSPELPPNVEVPPPDPNAPRATALDAINVRSGPGINYASYGVAPKGSQGEIIGISEDGQWWVVKVPTSLVGTGQGWVSADWVLAENASDVPVIPPPP